MSLRQRIRTRLAEEHGVVIEYVLALIAIALVMSAAGLAESLDARTLTTRDTRVRRAQQAAEAGVQRVLYQQGESNIDNWNLNGGPLQLSTTLDCIPMTLNASGQITGLTTASVNNAGVCPQTSGGSGGGYTDALGNHAFEQAEFIPGQTNPNSGAERIYWPKIVSLGYDDNGTGKVYSREEVILKPIAPLQAVEGMGNVTINGTSAFGVSSVAVNGDISARSTLTLPSVYAGVNLSTTLSGSVKATVEAPTISGTIVSTVNGGTTSQGNIPLRPLISVSASKASCPTVGCSGIATTGMTGSDGYSAATDTFAMTRSTETATFSSGDYVFCNFNVTAGTVNINTSSVSASAPVRIFVDSPTSSRCSSNGYTKTGGVYNGGNFNAATGINNTLSGLTAPSAVQVYVVGDGSYDNANTVSIAATTTCKLSVLGVCTVANTPATQMMVVYAPSASTTVNTGACVISGICAAGVFDGAVIGDNVTVTAATITQDLDLGNYPLYDGVTVFRPAQYIECDASVTSLQGINDSSPTPSDITHDTSGC